MKMLCRVTDNPNLPGFIINCKDEYGTNREIQVYFNPDSKQIVVCTSMTTDMELSVEDQIHKRYDVPFVDINDDKEGNPCERTGRNKAAYRSKRPRWNE